METAQDATDVKSLCMCRIPVQTRFISARKRLSHLCCVQLLGRRRKGWKLLVELFVVGDLASLH